MKIRNKIFAAILCTGLLLTSTSVVYAENDLLSDGAVALDDGFEDADSISEIKEASVQQQEVRNDSEEPANTEGNQEETTKNLTEDEEDADEESEQEVDENEDPEGLEVLSDEL